MAFDRNDPTHLLALKNEVLLDPTGRGYDPDASEAILLDQLNNPDQNLTPENRSAPMTAEMLLDAIFDVSVSSQDQFKVQLMYEGVSSFQEDLSRFKAGVKSLSGAISTAIDTIIRPISRAEVLFSNQDINDVAEFVTISVLDWRTARDS